MRKLSIIEKIDGIMILCLKLSLTMGFIFIFSYCFLYVNWFPIGVSFTETISLLMLSLGIGIIILILILVPAYCLSEGFKYYKESKISDTVNLALSAVILVWVGCAKIGMNIWEVIVVLFIILSYSFFIFQISYGRIFINWRFRLIYILYISVFTLFFMSINSNSQTYLTKQLGLSYSQVSFQVSEKDFQLLKSQINNYGLNNIRYDEQNKIIYPVDIKLRGIGTYTLVEIGDEKIRIRMEIKTEESKIIKIKNLE